MGTAESKYRDTIARLDGSGYPRTRTFSLQRNNQSLRCCVMKRAWEEAGESLDDPGTVDQTFFPEEGILVVEFNNGEE